MQPSSTVAKVGATSGVLALVMMIAGYIIPLLPAFGVPKDISDKAQQAYQWAKDHPDEIKAIQDQLEGKKSTPSPSPAPAPQPAPQPAPSPQPVIVTPPAPVVVPPVPAPVPVPVNPPPPLLLPLATIVVSDSTGKPVVGGVDCGRLFVVQSKGSIHADSPGSVSWVVDKSSPQDVDAIPYPDGTGYACVLRNKATATFSLAVASAGQVSQAMVRVTCNTGPMPPPDVTPEPKPEPKPEPTPALSQVRLMLLYDPMFDSPQQAKIRNADTWWEGIRSQGNDYRFYTTGTNDTKGKAALAYATSKQVSPPCLVASTMSDVLVDAIPSPSSVEEIEGWLKKITRK